MVLIYAGKILFSPTRVQCSLLRSKVIIKDVYLLSVLENSIFVIIL